MLRIGFVGWRGMVGSVLMRRMREEEDLSGFEPVFFSTSNVGGSGPQIGLEIPPLKDAYDKSILSSLDIILTCQGGEYTKKVYPSLRRQGWKGYWIDSASALRMDEDSIIVLDPVNRKVIDAGLSAGVKTFAGGNCTVSLMLMALGGLFEAGQIEWLSSMTYQAASGGGAKHMRELIAQMNTVGDACKGLLEDPASSAIALDELVTRQLRDGSFPVDQFQAPLAASLIPWIDSAMQSGQTREEWKGFAETNKILQADPPIMIDGLCVRIGAMRCHSQAFTIKLRKDLPLAEIREIIGGNNEWVKVVPNEKEASLRDLTPAAASGTLSVPVGRLRKMLLGPEYLTAFTVGDQLLWGAAEPIRRALKIVIRHLS